MSLPIKTVCIGLFAALALCGCGSSNSGDVPVLRSGTEYQQTLVEAQKLSQAHIEAFRNGEELDERAKSELKRARVLFQALLEYNSQNVAPVFGAAEIDNALGDLDSAARNYRQTINLMPANPSNSVIALVAEAHNQLANILILQNKYRDADVEASAAIQLVPNHAPYLATLASAKVQEGEKADAFRLCTKALSIDSTNSRASDILKLLQAAEEDKAQEKKSR